MPNDSTTPSYHNLQVIALMRKWCVNMGKTANEGDVVEKKFNRFAGRMLGKLIQNKHLNVLCSGN